MLPESWQFLGMWWWVLHVIGIALVFGFGYLVGRQSALPPEKNEWQNHLSPSGPPGEPIERGRKSTDSPQSEP